MANYNKYLFRALGSMIIAATWLLAIGALLSGNWFCFCLGCVFLAGKGIMLLATLAGLATHFGLALKLFLGRYEYDLTGGLGLWQSLLRHGWELPQMGLGYLVGMLNIVFGWAKKVECCCGVTIVVCEKRESASYMGMSLSPIVNIWLPRVGEEEIDIQEKGMLGELCRHEYGHTVDSLIFGWLYLAIIGLPSLMSVVAESKRIGGHRHADLYAERRADRHGTRLLKKH